MKFPEDNNIVYGQDFGWFVGIPSNVDFEIESVEDNRIILIADDYGRLDKKDKYGNGSICVYLRTKKDFGKDTKINTESLNDKLLIKFEEIAELLKEVRI